MTNLRATLLVSAVVLALSVAGCAPEPSAGPPVETAPPATSSSPTPTPTPQPTTSAIADLMLSPDGLGPLEIGQSMSSAASEFGLTYFDPDCSSEPEGSGAPDASEPGSWRANYPDGEKGLRPFVPVSFDGVLGIIAVHSPEIATTEGLHLGSSRSEVMAAFPNGFSTELENKNFSRVYVVDGKLGRLLIEVRSNDASYWGEIPMNVVNALTVIGVDDEPFAISGGDAYYWGVCNAP